MLPDNFTMFDACCPMTVPLSDNESESDFIKRWAKFDGLSENEKDILSADLTIDKLQNIASLFKLSIKDMATISRSIRNYYFGELKLEDMPAVLAREIPIDLAKAQEISRMVIQKIINDNSVEQATQAKLVQITVADSLKAYPEVGEQLITSDKIVLKNFPDPARPCLKNWLADFTFTLGRDKHTAMDRGIYLFQGANGKRLNSQDRNKLAYVLKAFDENLPVSVNKDTKQIVFGPSPQPSPYQGEGEQASHPSPSSALRAPSPQVEKGDNESLHSKDIHNMVRFSSPQKLPYEQKQSQPYVIKPVLPRQEPLPKNVVNLRDDF